MKKKTTLEKTASEKLIIKACNELIKKKKVSTFYDIQDKLPEYLAERYRKKSLILSLIAAGIEILIIVSVLTLWYTVHVYDRIVDYAVTGVFVAVAIFLWYTYSQFATKKTVIYDISAISHIEDILRNMVK